MSENEIFKGADAWKQALPQPICEDAPEYDFLYQRAWELAHDHVRHIEGMPQTPYMDEAFCDTQIWIWDTCFMTLFCKYAPKEFPGVESLRNFYDVLYGDKRLASVIVTDREPEWIGATVGEPREIQIHLADNPPLFAFAEYENALFHGDLDHLRDLLCNRRVLQKHYDWLNSLSEPYYPRGVHARTRMAKEKLGYRWEGGRSGMDNTPRGKTEERTEKSRPNNPDMLWIDAICQQALSARLIAKMLGLLGETEEQREWERRYEEQKELVNRYYWDDEDGFYYDTSLDGSRRYKVKTTASYWALVADIASDERARRMLDAVLDENELGGEVPLISLSRSDGNYEHNGKYWRGALWLPTAYSTLRGLTRYGFHEEAHGFGRKIVDHMLKTYQSYEPHTIWECYSPEKPEPSVSDADERVRPDFCGWSALGPISVYIENVIGFHSVDAFKRLVRWHKPKEFQKTLGIRNLRFGDVVTDVVAVGNVCRVKSNAPYTLEINGTAYSIEAGEQEIAL